jgi:hypothetical protein
VSPVYGAGPCSVCPACPPRLLRGSPASRGERSASRGERLAPRPVPSAPRGRRLAFRGERLAPRGCLRALRGEEPASGGEPPASRGHEPPSEGEPFAFRGETFAPRGGRLASRSEWRASRGESLARDLSPQRGEPFLRKTCQQERESVPLRGFAGYGASSRTARRPRFFDIRSISRGAWLTSRGRPFNQRAPRYGVNGARVPPIRRPGSPGGSCW